MRSQRGENYLAGPVLELFVLETIIGEDIADFGLIFMNDMIFCEIYLSVQVLFEFVNCLINPYDMIFLQLILDCFCLVQKMLLFLLKRYTFDDCLDFKVEDLAGILHFYIALHCLKEIAYSNQFMRLLVFDGLDAKSTFEFLLAAVLKTNMTHELRLVSWTEDLPIVNRLG